MFHFDFMSQPDPAEIQRAVQLHFSGQWDEAERMYRGILGRFPNDPSATHLLGMLLHARGNNFAAEPLLKRSIELAPQVQDFHNNYALFCSAVGRLDEAMGHLRRAMELNPSAPAPYENMGMVFELQGRHEEAASAYGKALAVEPNRVKSLTRRGWTLWRIGRAKEALEQWERAIQIEPRYADAHDGLCVALSQLRRVDEAILHGQQSVQNEPGNPDAWMNLGGALSMQSRLDEAIQCIDRALRIHPNFVEAMANKAWLMKQKGDAEGSLVVLEKALKLDPNSLTALNQLAHSLHVVGDLDGAVRAAKRAVELNPQFAAAWVNMGSAYLDIGEPAKAIEAARRAVELSPGFHTAHSNLLLAMNYEPEVDPKAAYDEHRRFEVIQVLSQDLPRMVLKNDPNPDRVLRVGYVSPDFRKHAVASFVEPILRAHDRSGFEVYCYSDVRNGDAVTKRLRGYATSWHDTASLSPEELARLVADHRIDILVDLAGHTADSRLLAFAQRPAPVQISYLGYLNTTGLEAMDYRITDAIANPPGEGDAFYTEKLIRLPCFFCLQPPEGAPAVGPLPVEKNGYVTFGSLNQPAKFNARVLELWAKVLKSVDGSRLMLNANSTGAAERRLLEGLMGHGIARERIEIIYRQTGEEYLKTYQRMDIALDPFPFSGHTTSCDALWMGVPVITLAGRVYASRTCASVLTHLGLEELVTVNTDQYIRTAAKWAGDLARLAELRKSLRQRIGESVITNASEFTGHLEKAYREVWREWCGTQRR